MAFRSIAEFLDPANDHHPTTAELKLIATTQAGRDCYLCDKQAPSCPTEDSDANRIRADLLRLLITGGSKDCNLHERGVTLFGGWIDGTLDLAFCNGRGRTVLRFCRFPKKLRFQAARLQLFSLNGSVLPEGLFAQGMKVKGSVHLRNINSGRMIDLTGATIGGQFDCFGAKLDGGRSRDGVQTLAMSAQGVEIGRDLSFADATVTGTISLIGARIGAQVSFTKAKLDGGINEKGARRSALNAQGLKTGGNLLLRNMTTKGTISLNSAKIGGQLFCSRSHFDGGTNAKGIRQTALYGQRMLVTKGFFFGRFARVEGGVDLTAAHVSDLVDDMASWPVEADQLILDGFTYARIDGATTLAERSDWLATGSHRPNQYHPQPYTQFARVLRQMGHATEARKVLIERSRLQAKATRSGRRIAPNGDVSVAFRSLWADTRNLGALIIDWVGLWVAGYGYAPVRSLGWLIGLLLLATTLAHFTWKEGSFAPNSDVVLTSPGWASVTALDCFPVNLGVCDQNPAKTWANAFTASADAPTQGADWDSFNRYGYAADLVVPFLDLGQTDAWAPSKDRGPWGWWLWWMRWVLASAGWIVTGLGVAAVTGVMQRNQPE